MRPHSFKKVQAKNMSGFTILEVLVVLAIIGSIMGLVATNIIGAADDAKIKTTKSQIKLIEGALDLYKLDNYQYPTTEQGLEALINKPTSSPEPKNYKAGGYLKGNKVPTDDWNNELVYFRETANKYVILSMGADGVEGGEDDISSND